MPEMILKRTVEGSETWNGKGEVTSAEIKYLVIHPATKRAAMQACFTDAPDHIEAENADSLSKSGVRFDGISGDGCYEISVLYEEESDNAGGEYSSGSDVDKVVASSFDCGGGTRHITHGTEQVIIDGELDPGGAIGWNGKYGSESQIAGVDIPAAQIRESYTRRISKTKLTTAFRRKVASMVGSVNNAPYKGWNPGEVLFLGCTYSSSNENKKQTTVDVVYNFAIRTNEESFTCNGKTYSCQKKGHEYVWMISDTVVKEGEAPKLDIKGIYHEKNICPGVDFGEFGLGR